MNFSICYSNKLWNVSLGIEIPTPSACVGIAEDFLSDNGLLPVGASLLSVGSSNISAFNPETLESLSKILHYQVTYQMSIGEYAIVGPRAQISVIVGEGGEILSFDYSWREMELHDTVPVISYESILAMHGIAPSEVLSHSLQYYAGPDNQHEDFLLPSYDIIVEPDTDGVESAVPYQLSATEFAPLIAITSPGADSTFQVESLITFNCTIQNGTAPFTYSWASDIDGHLSNENSFTTPGLSAATRNGETIPHIITLTVEDTNGMMTGDFVLVTVTAGFPISQNALIAGIAILCFIAVILMMRKRRGASAILFLLAFLSAFLLIPVASASGEANLSREINPNNPTGAYDDGVKEIGIEWVGVTHHKPLYNTETNIEGFYNHMGTTGGYNREFNWGEYCAWETDFTYVDIGGNDVGWVDAVDFVYYQDHGGPNGFALTSEHNDKSVVYPECRWGDGDLEWIVLDACSPLAWENPDDGKNVWERWAPTLQGLHMILSFATGSSNVKTRGTRFATYLTQGHRMMDAWFWACAETQDSNCLSAVLYATAANDPWNPGWNDPSNDHAHGFGSVCADPTPAVTKWFVYIVAQC